jgi:hypothetical protein
MISCWATLERPCRRGASPMTLSIGAPTLSNPQFAKALQLALLHFFVAEQARQHHSRGDALLNSAMHTSLQQKSRDVTQFRPLCPGRQARARAARRAARHATAGASTAPTKRVPRPAHRPPSGPGRTRAPGRAARAVSLSGQALLTPIPRPGLNDVAPRSRKKDQREIGARAGPSG